MSIATTPRRQPSARSRRGLDGLNFFLADVQTGVGPFLAIYLADYHWDPGAVGTALMVGGLAGIAAQTPAGALVDRLRAKRTLVAAGVVALAAAALLIAFVPRFWPVMAAQALIGATSSVFVPTVCAISMGLVGREAFDRRQGRNQTFNSAGNVVAAVGMGAIGYYLANRDIFFFVVAMVAPTLVCLVMVDPAEIDHEAARGCEAGGDQSSSVWALLRDRRVVVFLACCVMFHFANAAMLPLLGEMLAKGKGKSSMLFMSACVVTTQAVVTVIAGPVGRLASTRGRKPLLLVGFAALPVRGVLYTLTHNAAMLVAIQVLDGVAAAVFGVVAVLVIADLTRGTGRFNLAQGAIATAIGIGASLSQAIAGHVVRAAGYNAGFLFLAAVAAAGLGAFWVLMPETGGGTDGPTDMNGDPA